MAIKMVREPSETPNINNIDDIVPMRYAYGNQNGYVIGKGTEISNTVNGLNFTVNSGRLVLQGVECDIDASGVTITIDNIATKRYYAVYLEVNLGLNTATIKSEYDTATYPNIDAGDDLTENTTGIARLPLYRFIATSGVISNVNKVVESVKYVNETFIKNVKVNNAGQADNATTSSNSNKVNNLEITKDENGVLKIGDIIIPQKKLLWSGNVSGQGKVVLSESLSIGDIIEIELSVYGNDLDSNITYILKSKVVNGGRSDNIYQAYFNPIISRISSNNQTGTLGLFASYYPGNKEFDIFNFEHSNGILYDIELLIPGGSTRTIRQYTTLGAYTLKKVYKIIE